MLQPCMSYHYIRLNPCCCVPLYILPLWLRLLRDITASQVYGGVGLFLQENENQY